MDNSERPQILSYRTPSADVEVFGWSLGSLSLLLAITTDCLVLTHQVWERGLSGIFDARVLFACFAAFLNSCSWVCGFVAGHRGHKLDVIALIGWLLSTFNMLIILSLF